MTYKEYHLIGLRNQRHADKVLSLINRLDFQAEVTIDKDDLSIRLSSEGDLKAINRILAFEKAGLHEHYNTKLPTKEESHHHHSHQHAIDFTQESQSTRNMLIVFVINFVFSILEFIFGALFNSSAILADAVHDLGDSLSVALAWVFQKISTRGSDVNYSYGYKRFSLLGALITSAVLLGGSVIMIVHASGRILVPEEVNYQGMFWLAIFAIMANGYSAWLISRGTSHNESILSLHLLEDILGWIGVLVVSIVLNFTDWYILDPLLSLAIALFIIYKTLPEFIEIGRIFLQATPDDIDIQALRQAIQSVPGVNNLAHFHIWSLDGERHMISLTVSTTTDSIEAHERIKNDIRQHLIEHHLTHSNIEIVYDPQEVLVSK